MLISGAIFDVDGTLLDSMAMWENVAADYLRSRGREPREDLNEVFRTMSLPQGAEYMQREYSLPVSQEAVVAGVNAMIADFYCHTVLPKPGVKQALELLKQRGVRCAVATATDRGLVSAALERNGLLHYFIDILTCTDLQTSKDRPLIFQASREVLQTPLAETWVFEDALHAVRTAKLAGFPVLAVADATQKPFEQEIRQIADIYIETFAEMEELLNENRFDHSRLG